MTCVKTKIHSSGRAAHSTVGRFTEQLLCKPICSQSVHTRLTRGGNMGRHTWGDLRAAHIQKGAAHIQKGAAHIQRRAARIQRRAAHIQRRADRIQKEVAHIQKRSDRIQKRAAHIQKILSISCTEESSSLSSYVR